MGMELVLTTVTTAEQRAKVVLVETALETVVALQSVKLVTAMELATTIVQVVNRAMV